MAKPIFGARLLRSISRAGKSQQKLMTQLFGVPAVKAKPKAKAVKTVKAAVVKLAKPAAKAAKPSRPAGSSAASGLSLIHI